MVEGRWPCHVAVVGAGGQVDKDAVLQLPALAAGFVLAVGDDSFAFLAVAHAPQCGNTKQTEVLHQRGN